MNGLHIKLNIDTEQFASPLNENKNNHTYGSLYTRGFELIGMHSYAFGRPFPRFYEANLPCTHELM